MKRAAPRIQRTSSIAAAKRISAQVRSEDGAGAADEVVPPAIKSTPLSEAEDDAFASDTPGDTDEPPPKKRRQTSTRKKGNLDLFTTLFSPSSSTSSSPCLPPARLHSLAYHRPPLLDSSKARADLLTWFDTISTSRGMPWRKPFINPATHSSSTSLRTALENRAYEVWISEIMLQQTRVAVVIDYWNRWMAKWPSIHSLAAAEADEVLSAWRGLGYYSRAGRIHQAAKMVVSDEKWTGLLPDNVDELEKVPGIGRYTAGAIAAIVFGRAEAMVDGNVLRVLSRQMAVLGNVKTEKQVIDMLWAAADALVKAAAGDGVEAGGQGSEIPASDRPGRWGQALMELGSTVCTPKPNCEACPISSTCRAYAEGSLLASSPAAQAAYRKLANVDIEDACTVCEPLQDAVEIEGRDTVGGAEPTATKQGKSRAKKNVTISSFFQKEKVDPDGVLDAKFMATVVQHAQKFPLKVIKNAVRQEQTLVCAIRRPDGRYLIQKRPDKGLLAGLWEFPSQIVSEQIGGNAKTRKKTAESFVSGLLGAADHNAGKPGKRKDPLAWSHCAELGSVPWLFSHIKLIMHVYVFELQAEHSSESTAGPARRRWASAEAIEAESIGTGMRKCWVLARDAASGA